MEWLRRDSLWQFDPPALCPSHRAQEAVPNLTLDDLERVECRKGDRRMKERPG